MASLLREELALLVAQEIEFKDMFVTVTDVLVNGDLEDAQAKVSVLPSERAHDALKILRPFEHRFHGFLVRKLNIRPIPRIRFVIDHGPEKAAEVEKKLMGEDTVGN